MRRIFRTPGDDTIERWFWIAILSLACFGTHLAAFYGGGWFVIETARAEAARIVKETPRRANPATFRPNIFCDKDEYRRICSARERMTAIGGEK